MVCSLPRVNLGIGGVPSAFYCRRCRECRKMLRSQKISAICLEASLHHYGGAKPVGAFVLLTYSPANLPKVARDTRVLFAGEDRPSGRVGPELVASLNRSDAQAFVKRVRQRCFPVEDRKKAAAAELRSQLGILAPGLRFAMCGEYGGKTWRPHYHVVFFGFPGCARKMSGPDPSNFSCRCEVCSFYRDCWGHGHVAAGHYGLGDTASYISNYTTKLMTAADDPLLEGRRPEFFQASTKPALGDAFVDDVASEILDFEDNGANVDDFPREFRLAGQRVVLTDRQVRLGRAKIGRCAETPQVVKDERAAAVEDIQSLAMGVRDADLRRAYYRELYVEKFGGRRKPD